MKGQISLIDGYEYEAPSPLKLAAIARRLVRPQDQYGLMDNGKTCKTCDHVVCRRRSRTYYKCEMWVLSSSEGSDIRLSWPACKLYVEAANE